ncbi:MAG: hypothetical protein Q9M20_03770 [Mariprofundaceae bacterium]|nr:hypothetical protein [Mariprofundaceae bacterium]
MFVSCPQCKAQYLLEANIKNVILICHRCDTEFSSEPDIKDGAHSPNIAARPELRLDSGNEVLAVMPLPEKMVLPKRGKVRVWPWLILVLLCAAGLGIWNNQNQWLSQPWVRSLMMNVKLPITPEARDWELVEESLNSQWVDRQDGSRVLVVSGYIHNRLLSDQIPPSLRVRFFDVPHSSAVDTRSVAIYEPPSLVAIQHAPYLPPPIDQVPVSAGGQRAFTLILENIPEQYQEISMSISVP